MAATAIRLPVNINSPYSTNITKQTIKAETNNVATVVVIRPFIFHLNYYFSQTDWLITLLICWDLFDDPFGTIILGSALDRFIFASDFPMLSWNVSSIRKAPINLHYPSAYSFQHLGSAVNNRKDGPLFSRVSLCNRLASSLIFRPSHYPKMAFLNCSNTSWPESSGK